VASSVAPHRELLPVIIASVPSTPSHANEKTSQAIAHGPGDVSQVNTAAKTPISVNAFGEIRNCVKKRALTNEIDSHHLTIPRI
jgi:hypothetical protein